MYDNYMLIVLGIKGHDLFFDHVALVKHVNVFLNTNKAFMNHVFLI